MPRLRTARPSRARKGFVLQKPNGQLVPRVQAVGPEHFGIVAIDCAKARSRYFLADFYGRTLLEPTTLPHSWVVVTVVGLAGAAVVSVWFSP